MRDLNKRERKESLKRLLSGEGEYCKATHQVSFIFENGTTLTTEVLSKRTLSRDEFPEAGEFLRNELNKKGANKIKKVIFHN